MAEGTQTLGNPLEIDVYTSQRYSLGLTSLDKCVFMIPHLKSDIFARDRDFYIFAEGLDHTNDLEQCLYLHNFSRWLYFSYFDLLWSQTSHIVLFFNGPLEIVSDQLLRVYIVWAYRLYKNIPLKGKWNTKNGELDCCVKTRQIKNEKYRMIFA